MNQSCPYLRRGSSQRRNYKLLLPAKLSQTFGIHVISIAHQVSDEEDAEEQNEWDLASASDGNPSKQSS